MAQYNDFVQYLIDEGEQKGEQEGILEGLQKGILEGKQDENADVADYKDRWKKAQSANEENERKVDAFVSWFKEHNIPVPAEVMNPPKAN